MIYNIKEDGKNGTVELSGGALIRTKKRTLGKDDRQVIPVVSVSHVELDRKRLGSDLLTVHVGPTSFTWKTPKAEELANAILAAKGVVS